MYTDVNLEALKRLVVNNRNARDFDLSLWVQPCGTYGCMVGNDLIACGKRLPAIAFMVFEEAGQHYGVSTIFARWLFGHEHHAVDRRGIVTKRHKSGGLFLSPSNKYRDDKDLGSALARVEKYIAYVERKRQMIHESDGRIKESARRTEGNWLVCPKVMESLAVAT